MIACLTTGMYYKWVTIVIYKRRQFGLYYKCFMIVIDNRIWWLYTHFMTVNDASRVMLQIVTVTYDSYLQL